VDLPLPSGPYAPFVVSLLLSEEGHFALAERCARRAVALQADYPPALLALGIALDGLGRTREAEASLNEALALDPAYGHLYGRLVYCLSERPDAAGAVRELERLAPLGYPYSLLARMALRRFPDAAVPDAGMRPPGVRGRPS
jgi:Flp pilus assembly protein TadD